MENLKLFSKVNKYQYKIGSWVREFIIKNKIDTEILKKLKNDYF
jgi:hypothetical protein